MTENKRLLIDEEIKRITQGTHRDFPSGLRICEAQDAKTAEAVRGEEKTKIKKLVEFVEWLRDEEAVAQDDWDLHCEKKWQEILEALKGKPEKE